MIPYGRQMIGEDDVKAVAEALRHDYLTTGPKVGEFEGKIANYVNAKHCVAVNSGTSALDIAVASLNLPPGSEIITTPFTFVASSNCILYNGCRPVFADIGPKTYNISPDEIKRKITGKTKAILCVDYAGQPCSIDEIREIADEHNLFLIEDAAHSLGAKYKGEMVGGLADLTTFSFHPVKVMTTGEGGAVATNNDELYEKMKMLRSHGIDKGPLEREGYEYDMKVLGRNYRLTDFQCALGMKQLERVGEFIRKRNEIAKMYNDGLAGVDGITLPHVSDYVRHAWHLYTILLSDRIKRDKFFAEIRGNGIGVNVHYIPVYKFTYYHGIFGAQTLPITEDISSRIVSLPMFPGLSENDVDNVIRKVKECIRE